MRICVITRTTRTFCCIERSMRITGTCRLCLLSSTSIKQADRSSSLAALALEAECLLAIGRATMWQIGTFFDFPSTAISYFKYSEFKWWEQISAASTKTLPRSCVRDGCSWAVFTPSPGTITIKTLSTNNLTSLAKSYWKHHSLVCALATLF